MVKNTGGAWRYCPDWSHDCDRVMVCDGLIGSVPWATRAPYALASKAPGSEIAATPTSARDA